MAETTEIEKLVALLSAEPPEIEITFREESLRDIRYTLVVRTNDNALLRKLARVFGCREGQLPAPGDTRFEAGDDWHGRGELDLRELADEFFQTEGEFFDFDITINELRMRVLETKRIVPSAGTGT